MGYDGPDNITVSPHGYALACSDGEDGQWLVGITEDGKVFPFAFNGLQRRRPVDTVGDEIPLGVRSIAIEIVVCRCWRCTASLT